MNIQNLAPDALIYCLKYLQDVDLFLMACVDTNFQRLANHPELWNLHLSNSLAIYDQSYPPGYNAEIEYTPKSQYLSWKRSFAGYSMKDVGRVRSWWQRFSLWCARNAPMIFKTLGPPANETHIKDIESQLDIKFPDTLRLLYRFHDGQTDINDYDDAILGMFGGTIFYDMVTCMKFCSLEHLFATPIEVTLADTTYSVGGGISFGIFEPNASIIGKVYVVAPDPRNSTNNIVCVNGDGGEMFLPCHPVGDPQRQEGGDGLMMWLTEYLRRLEEGVFAFEPLNLKDPSSPIPPYAPAMISHFPLKPIEQLTLGETTPRNIGASTAVTNGVEVVACPVFVPERSSVSRPFYFWYYSIRLRLLRDDLTRPQALTRCQLQTRHWRIYDPREGVSHVDGEAVVGLYPLLDIAYSQPDDNTSRNLPFAYQSGCSSTGVPGTFEGHMTFVQGSRIRPTGPQFDVKVEQFSLAIPDFIF